MKNTKNLPKLFIIIAIIAVIIILSIVLLNKNKAKKVSQRRKVGFEILDESNYSGYKEKLY